MKFKKYYIFAILIVLILYGCAQQQKMVSFDPESQINDTQYTQVRIFGETSFGEWGEKYYQAVMTYKPREGILRVDVTDKYGKQKQLIQDKRIKALIKLENQDIREFYFNNPRYSAVRTISYDSKRHNRELRKSTDRIEAKEKWLVDRASYKLKMWLPVEGITYVISYSYAG